MKIFFYTLRPDEHAACERYSRQYGIEYAGTAAAPAPENLALAEGCAAVGTNPCAILPEYLEQWHKMGVRWLPCRSIGYDHIPLARAKELGMRVAHSHYPPEGVANYAIMLMLMATRRMGHILQRAALQDWSLPGKMGRDLSSCTVGVLGTGKIGTTVLRHLSAFGCTLLAYDKCQNPEAARLARYVDLPTLYRESDVLTLHLNVTPETFHILDAAAFAQMKPGAVLVNTARGTLVDPDALIAALESGKLGGAGLDVIHDEDELCYYDRAGEVLKNRELALLRSYPNVILSPHAAFYTDVNVASMVESAFAATAAFAKGEPCADEVAL